MKIIHAINLYVPNMGYQDNLLPAEQKKIGYDVEIITSDRVPLYKGYEQNIGKIFGKGIIGVGIYVENNIKIHRLPCFLEIENRGQIILKGLKNKFKKLRPDVVQVHGAFCPVTLEVIYYSYKFG